MSEGICKGSEPTIYCKHATTHKVNSNLKAVCFCLDFFKVKKNRHCAM